MKATTLFLIIFLMASCGARKRTVERDRTETKTETLTVSGSTSETKTDLTIIGNSTETTETNETETTVEIIPIDKDKPVIFTNPSTKNKDTVYNASVKFRKSNKTESKDVKSDLTLNDNSSAKVIDRKETKSSENVKNDTKSTKLDRQHPYFMLTLVFTFVVWLLYEVKKRYFTKQ